MVSGEYKAAVLSGTVNQGQEAQHGARLDYKAAILCGTEGGDGGAPEGTRGNNGARGALSGS
jgi:hypothetical protein